MTPLPVAGLTTEEANSRKSRGLAAGELPQSGRSYGEIIRQNMFNFLNLTLIAIGLILIAMGLLRDAVLSAGLAVLNGAIGIVQETIAKRRLDEITLLSQIQPTVIRDGVRVQINSSDVVVGDALEVGPGDQIMVDGKVIGDGRLSVDESLLTGESNPIPKREGDPVYAGSYCVSGTGFYEAEKVGAMSLAGSITAGAKATRVPQTPMQRDVNLAIRVLLLIAGTYLGLVLIGSLIHEVPFQDTVLAAAVVVGIVPSGLFLMITVTYSMATLRMARENALVQQVNAIESLSNVDMFCMDKTGTLTANRLVLVETRPIEMPPEEANRLAGCFVASTFGGTKTSEAILTACGGTAQPVLDEVPFSSALKWSGVALDGELAKGVFVLGAPEMVSPHLQHGSDLKPPSEWTERGLRVLLFASDSTATTLHDSAGDIHLPPSLTPAAWFAFSDELRPNLQETLDGFRKAGIEVKVISGDNPETVAALARQAGMGDGLKLVSGPELEAMSESEFDVAAAESTVFGRITPEQKERLVRSLRDQGHYVAMTGDGVNDVLSLKQANLGIAMQSGSQATRASADIVLLNDSFSALPRAFQEGKRIRNGLQSILELFLSRVFAVAFVIAGVVVLQASFPFSPGHMTLLTLLTVGIPTFGLALWAVPGTLPRSLFVALIRFVVPASLMVTLLALGVYLFYYFGISESNLIEIEPSTETRLTSATEVARSALTTVMVLSGLWLVIFSSPPTAFWAVCEEKTGEWRPTLLAVAMIPFFVIILLIPALRDFFGVELLTVTDYVALLLIAVVWGFGLRYIWAHRLVDRFFHVNLQETQSKT